MSCTEDIAHDSFRTEPTSTMPVDTYPRRADSVQREQARMLRVAMEEIREKWQGRA